jgi:Uma2 family endonuclease
MEQKRRFYEQYGVEEYYIYDPDTFELVGWLRDGGTFRPIADLRGWTSPRLGVRFEPSDGDLLLFRPDGVPFRTFVEVSQQLNQVAHQRDELAHERDELAHERDELIQQRDRDRERAERLAAQLRALGLEPEA